MSRAVSLAVLAVCSLSAAATAQGQGEALSGRMEPQTVAAVQALVDSARAAGLPAGPLVAKALEGAAKRATGERIVLAVRALVTDLDRARSAFGADAQQSEIAAGATALRSGVEPAALKQLRGVQSDLSVALGVLTDLVINGVPVDTAVAAVHQLAARGAADVELAGLAREVRQDVSAGVPPGVAAIARAASYGAPLMSHPPRRAAPARDPVAAGAPRP